MTQQAREATLQDATDAADVLFEADKAAAKARNYLYAVIRELRRLGYRPTDIADAAGLTRQRISQILGGER